MDLLLSIFFAALVAGIILTMMVTYVVQSVSAGHCPFMCKFRKKWDYKPWEHTGKPFLLGTLFGGPVGPTIGGFWALGSTVVNKAKEWAVPQPSSVGCYCGVSEKSGKYLHAKMDPDNGEVWEFHLTGQPPSVHNEYSVPDTIDHHSDCDIDESWDQYTNSSSCLIFSVKEKSGDDKCSLINVSTGTSITGEIDTTVKEEIGNENWEIIKGSDDHPLDGIAFGDKVKFKGKPRNPGYRSLLEMPEAYPPDEKVGMFLLWPGNLTCKNLGERTMWIFAGKKELSIGA